MKAKKDKIILDLCGGTGSWSEPYRKAGYKVINITFPKYDVTRRSETEHEGCLYFQPGLQSPGGTKTLRVKMADVYGILAAPPCTKFSKADTRKTRAEKDFTEGIETMRACLEIIWAVQRQGAPLAWWALENPQGYLSRFIGRSVFRFQHWQFGEKRESMARKRTELWGYFNSPIRTVRKRTFKTIYSKRGEKNEGWSKVPVIERAKTCAGFAAAFYKANK